VLQISWKESEEEQVHTMLEEITVMLEEMMVVLEEIATPDIHLTWDHYPIVKRQHTDKAEANEESKNCNLLS
jgi:hypothetical protein